MVVPKNSNGGIVYMLYLKTSVKNGIISLYPLNLDEMYYKK